MKLQRCGHNHFFLLIKCVAHDKALSSSPFKIIAIDKTFYSANKTLRRIDTKKLKIVKEKVITLDCMI